jgi:hypothetical protein
MGYLTSSKVITIVEYDLGAILGLNDSRASCVAFRVVQAIVAIKTATWELSIVVYIPCKVVIFYLIDI